MTRLWASLIAGSVLFPWLPGCLSCSALHWPVSCLRGSDSVPNLYIPVLNSKDDPGQCLLENSKALLPFLLPSAYCSEGTFTFPQFLS